MYTAPYKGMESFTPQEKLRIAKIVRSCNTFSLTTCSICLDDSSPCDAYLPCHLGNGRKCHTFHSECLGKWLDVAATCPMCRRSHEDFYEFIEPPTIYSLKDLINVLRILSPSCFTYEDGFWSLTQQLLTQLNLDKTKSEKWFDLLEDYSAEIMTDRC